MKPKARCGDELPESCGSLCPSIPRRACPHLIWKSVWNEWRVLFLGQCGHRSLERSAASQKNPSCLMVLDPQSQLLRAMGFEPRIIYVFVFSVPEFPENQSRQSWMGLRDRSSSPVFLSHRWRTATRSCRNCPMAPVPRPFLSPTAPGSPCILN